MFVAPCVVSFVLFPADSGLGVLTCIKKADWLSAELVPPPRPSVPLMDTLRGRRRLPDMFALKKLPHDLVSVSLCLDRQLKKLSEDSLTKQPEEVFDVLEKLGEG